MTRPVTSLKSVQSLVHRMKKYGWVQRGMRGMRESIRAAAIVASYH